MDDTGKASGGFVEGFCAGERVRVAGAAEGPLAGLGFAVKDIIDVEGVVSGCGNPDWRRTHPPAPRHAAAVARLLAAGASVVGKTITEELAYGLIGQNAFYGTPVNPAAPGRVPGGSSSGSASVVAAGLADFALGTDTGGSVRVPAAFCGLYGLRPSHGRVPLDGIAPLAPSLDTCGWFAREAELFRRVGTALLDWRDPPAPGRLLIAEDAFALADPDVAKALAPAVGRAEALLGPAARVRLGEGPGVEGFAAWQDTMRVIRGSEAAASHLAWIRESGAAMGPGFRERFETGGAYGPAEIARATAARAGIEGRLAALLADDAVLLVPAAPSVAPPAGAPEAIYARLRALNETWNAAAPLARLPQASLPLARTADGPVGLGLIAAHGNDELLLELAVRLAE